MTGSYIYDVYAGTLGRKLAFSEYSSDHQQVVGGRIWMPRRRCPEFCARAGLTKYRTRRDCVDAVLLTVQAAGVNLSAERTNLINAYNAAATTVDKRAAVVRAIADNALFKQAQYNPAFVLTEYFGYLRRDLDQSGYNFWLNVLNNGDPGNYRGMVCSFITSTEYQNRFSTIVTHHNSECGP